MTVTAVSECRCNRFAILLDRQPKMSCEWLTAEQSSIPIACILVKEKMSINVLAPPSRSRALVLHSSGTEARGDGAG